MRRHAGCYAIYGIDFFHAIADVDAAAAYFIDFSPRLRLFHAAAAPIDKASGHQSATASHLLRYTFIAVPLLPMPFCLF